MEADEYVQDLHGLAFITSRGIVAQYIRMKSGFLFGETGDLYKCPTRGRRGKQAIGPLGEL